MPAKMMLDAITREGKGIGTAWAMFRACYAYTRSHDGSVVSDAGDTLSFSRWYCFWEAVKCGLRYLR